MRKLSEVTKITGITRRALQGYHEVGLLSPSAYTEAGYWLYDEEAIQKLFVIKVFTDSGYSREQVKEFFQSSTASLQQECNEVIEELKAQQRQIEGMIRTVRLFKLESMLSDSARSVLSEIDPGRVYRDQSFANYLAVLSERMSLLPGEADVINLEIYLLFWYSMLVVGLLGLSEENTVSKDDINSAIDESFGIFKLLMQALDGFGGEFEGFAEHVKVELFKEFIPDYFNDKDIAWAMNDACGENAVDSILAVVREWRK
ncbi:MAG: MerR family transcriptional regulator [Raoultibacter sp.]